MQKKRVRANGSRVPSTWCMQIIENFIRWRPQQRHTNENENRIEDDSIIPKERRKKKEIRETEID